MSGIIKLTKGKLDPPIQTYKCWMAGSVAGYGEKRIRNFNPKLL